jgi:ribonuclease E
MTRQRIRPSLKRSVYKECPCCTGTGVVKTAESMAIEVVRLLMFAAQREGVARVSVTVAEDVANYLHNKKRREIAALEDQGNMNIQVFGREGASPEHLVMECVDANGREVKLPAAMTTISTAR